MAEIEFNATLYSPMQPDETISDYAVWMEICRRMDAEVTAAKLEWKQAVFERDSTYKQMKEHSDALRDRLFELEHRKKPSPPKRDRNDQGS